MASNRKSSWELYEIDSVPEEARTAWDALNADAANRNPALDYRFTELLVRIFGGGSERFAFCRIGTEYIAGVVLRPRAAMRWELYVPSQACLSPFVMARNVDAAELMSDLIRNLPGACLTLRCQRVDPACQPFDDLKSAAMADSVPYGTTYAIKFKTGFDEYWKARSKGLRYKIRKLEKTVGAAGLEATMSIVSNPDKLAQAVYAHGSLESKGWKGSEGTAINQGNLQGQFYSRILQAFSQDEDAFVAQLRFDDTLVASLLCIGLQKNIVVLKIAYDEDYAEFGPGRLADYYFLQWAFGNGDFKEAEMYTRASSADLSWATDSREWYDIDLCRNRAIYEGLKCAKRLKSIGSSSLAEGA